MSIPIVLVPIVAVVPAFTDIAKPSNDVRVDGDPKCAARATVMDDVDLFAVAHQGFLSHRRWYGTYNLMNDARAGMTDGFYRGVSSANIEVKSKAPNGVTFHVKGKSTHDNHTGGQVRAMFPFPPFGRPPPGHD